MHLYSQDTGTYLKKKKKEKSSSQTCTGGKEGDNFDYFKYLCMWNYSRVFYMHALLIEKNTYFYSGMRIKNLSTKWIIQSEQKLKLTHLKSKSKQDARN